jgi:protein NrfD
MIDPVMEIWGWQVPVYLFLGGLVAGMMIISGYFIYRGRHKEENCSCSILPPLGLVLLSIGMLALFLDLEHKLYAWRMYATFKAASPMSWGSWILLAVYPVLLASTLVRPLAWVTRRMPFAARWSGRLHRSPALLKTIGTANIVLGVMLGIYTGILLGAFGARPLWNSPVLGILFLVSGLSTAAALVHMIARDRDEREMLARTDIGFLTAELVILGLFLIGLATSTRVHGEAILVILGGLVLRFVIVHAGQVSHWTRTAGLP